MVRQGKIRFTRLAATSDPVTQRPDSPAPARHGYWAFPWPWFNMFWATHQYDPHAPKNARRGSHDTWYQNQIEWVRTHGRKVVKERDLWWNGPIYAQFDHHGNPMSDSGRLWVLHTPKQYLKAVRGYLGPRGRWGWDRTGDTLETVRYAVDHYMEVFLPTRTGRHQKSSYDHLP